MPEVGKACPGDETHVPRSDHCNLHGRKTPFRTPVRYRQRAGTVHRADAPLPALARYPASERLSSAGGLQRRHKRLDLSMIRRCNAAVFRGRLLCRAAVPRSRLSDRLPCAPFTPSAARPLRK
ncbi:hypothetical protein NMD1_02422 [Novosphingobium sp. MD-1]|nr:hypothetical protein NMD1_02422 [Novosphingobium sp. MD-1]